MSYWEGLLSDADKKALDDGANTMLRIAIKLTGKRYGNKRQLLQNECDDHQKT
jgi:hypothetical protein